MITEQQILDLGFRIFGIEEEDPYYKIVFENNILGKHDLSGNFNENGFEIYSMNKTYTDINEIILLFMVCDFKINYSITNRYGSDEPIRDEPYRDKPVNTKSTNEFIVELMKISDDKKQLPLVIQAPNKEMFPPQTKMLFKGSHSFDELEGMIITF